jgi:7-keto-8-aminopelargonate synthetase-like enzyme
LFPTGFATNLGVLSTFGGAGVTVVSDELNHASIIDGCRLARADVKVYHHADADHAAALMAEAPGRCVAVTDLVFSMDGDVAPVGPLAEACRRHDALLVLDEAHAVLGDEPDVECALLRIGTLSKTLGALGGFVCGDRVFTDLIVNRARSYIFTTASTPADAAAALAAVRILGSEEGTVLRRRLRRAVDRLRPGHPSPIVPILVGDEAKTVEVSERLLERGLLVPAIRPPTVPAGTSRLRVALSAAHSTDQLDRLAAGLDECWPTWRA